MQISSHGSCLLQISLRVCRSRCLMLTRWDALFNGDLNKIDPQRLPPEHTGKELWSFHQRSDNIRNQDSQLQQLQFRFKQAAQSIRLRFQSGYCNQRNGAVERRRFWSGLTGPDEVGGKPVINIATELLQPLLTGGLNHDEK